MPFFFAVVFLTVAHPVTLTFVFCVSTAPFWPTSFTGTTNLIVELAR